MTECYSNVQAEKGGEDAMYISPDGSVLVVADGVGGWAEDNVDPALYPRSFVQQCGEALGRETTTGGVSITAGMGEGQGTMGGQGFDHRRYGQGEDGGIEGRNLGVCHACIGHLACLASPR